MRLRRSTPGKGGYRRKGRGRGFSYHHADGAAVTDRAELDRIKALVIPPAWRDVWISDDPRGHIQAVGTDAAGRRQYRYHDVWRVKRDAAKFDHVLEVGERLPHIRKQVDADLHTRGFGRDRILAVAVRLLDVGCFRIGGEAYAAGEEGTFGLATLQREHVAVPRGTVRFCYPAKGGIERSVDVTDPDVGAVLRKLLRQDTGQEELLVYRDGRRWADVRSGDINAYLRDVGGIEISAKDFRTWHGTVLAARLLAREPRVTKRAVPRVMREVSEFLGNTPAVARASYVDPRVVDLYSGGVTIPKAATATRERSEAAVLELLADTSGR
ncbi:DNA topoisomerase IB [Dactylosporangium aurantiacum]|uniref:DNA topoisomerase n=1 Tax=Dactylosporangium aurantiacum TaxID=35754 RepID=A0A9Q9IK08_9ACTN|nr:DNA topoisomerase IB [Dactylosporangium aurantiacum]MDG6105668.1 DNA topoisomerase IB [Dactylosporangium aurantiacum]UWZ57001.1 DNA topoisomerase IB [Dactylosporangium aurantiacum]